MSKQELVSSSPAREEDAAAVILGSGARHFDKVAESSRPWTIGLCSCAASDIETKLQKAAGFGDNGTVRAVAMIAAQIRP